MEITFNELPEAVQTINERLARIEALLKRPAPEEIGKKWLSLAELCDYLPSRPARQTVYQWVSERRIPNHKTGKRLRFLKSEIDAWLLSGRRATALELQDHAINFLK